MNLDDVDPDEIRRALETIAEHGVPAPGTAWITDVGSKAFITFVNDELFATFVENGRSTCRFFDAPYGSGKTHLLDMLERTAVGREFAIVRADLSKALALDDWRAVTQHILEEIELTIDGVTARSLPDILALLQESGRGDVKRLQEHARLPHAGFHRAMLYAVQSAPENDGYETVAQYLNGERVRVADLRARGVFGVSDALSRRNAEHVLETVTHGLQLLGIPGTVILFDENEMTLDTHRTIATMRLQAAANVIRRFIDACFDGRLHGVLAVFAVLPGFVERCTRAYAALGQRLREPREHDASWRWPTLPLAKIAPVAPAEFANLAARRIEEIVGRLGSPSSPMLRTRLTTICDSVLAQNAGSGYKRPLMKALCTAALEEVDASWT